MLDHNWILSEDSTRILENTEKREAQLFPRPLPQLTNRRLSATLAVYNETYRCPIYDELASEVIENDSDIDNTINVSNVPSTINHGVQRSERGNLDLPDIINIRDGEKIQKQQQKINGQRRQSIVEKLISGVNKASGGGRRLSLFNKPSEE